MGFALGVGILGAIDICKGVQAVPVRVVVIVKGYEEHVGPLFDSFKLYLSASKF